MQGIIARGSWPKSPIVVLLRKGCQLAFFQPFGPWRGWSLIVLSSKALNYWNSKKCLKATWYSHHVRAMFHGNTRHFLLILAFRFQFLRDTEIKSYLWVFKWGTGLIKPAWNREIAVDVHRNKWHARLQTRIVFQPSTIIHRALHFRQRWKLKVKNHCVSSFWWRKIFLGHDSWKQVSI